MFFNNAVAFFEIQYLTQPFVLNFSAHFRFSNVAREILSGNIPSCAYDIHMKLCQMFALLYNRSVKCLGWSNDDILFLLKNIMVA